MGATFRVSQRQLSYRLHRLIVFRALSSPPGPIKVFWGKSENGDHVLMAFSERNIFLNRNDVMKHLKAPKGGWLDGKLFNLCFSRILLFECKHWHFKPTFNELFAPLPCSFFALLPPQKHFPRNIKAALRFTLKLNNKYSL